MKKETLEKAKRHIAWGLKELGTAEQSLKAAQDAYDKAVAEKVAALRAELEAEHAETVAALTAAKEAVDEEKKRVAGLRNTATSILQRWASYSDDKKPITGFARRDTMRPVILDEPALFKQLLQHAPHLLQIDHKALEKFVKAFAVKEDDDLVGLPSIIHMLLPALGVMVDKQWTISEKTIAKDAPDEKPAPISESEYIDIPF